MKRRSVSIRLSQPTIAWLEAYGDGSLVAGLRQAVRVLRNQQHLLDRGAGDWQAAKLIDLAIQLADEERP